MPFIFEVYYLPLDWILWFPMKPGQDESQMYPTYEFLDQLDRSMYQNQYVIGSCILKQ